MANVIKFEIETDATYDADEQVELLNAFADFMKGIDPDVIEDTEDVTVVSKASLLDKKNIDEDVAEWLDNATFTVKLNVTNGGLGFETTLK